MSSQDPHWKQQQSMDVMELLPLPAGPPQDLALKLHCNTYSLFTTGTCQQALGFECNVVF